VALGMILIAIGGSFLVHRAVRSEEKRLLSERASELGLLLAGDFGSLQTELETTAAETALNGADPAAFRAASNTLASAAPGGTTALADGSGASVRLLTARGAPISPAALNAAGAVIRRALTEQPAKVTTGVFDEGTTHVIGLAYPVGVADLAVYLQVAIDPEQAGRATATGEPFHELDVALYGGPTQDRSTLILITGGVAPLRGAVATASTTFGADEWLVAITARTPLVGTFAADAFWLVLAGGLVVALTLAALTESLARRRDYALALVDERTAELRDSVTQLEQAQEQLVRQARLAAIGELASAVGHELRNPLGVITNAHYLLRARIDEQGDERLSRQLTTAEREVTAATLIVGDLLDYARAREPVTAPVDMHDLLDEVLGVAPPPAGITISREDQVPCPPALGDRDQLRQVFLNLITNAYEAMPEQVGTLTIGLRSTGQRVQSTVSDSGTGMDAETLERLFEPFYTRKARGIGLGLAVTWRIVNAHDGTISVESASGSGSTFTVDLPAAASEVAR
jgi:signal transduction histidine kinase